MLVHEKVNDRCFACNMIFRSNGRIYTRIKVNTGFDDRMTGEVKRANCPIGLADFDSPSNKIKPCLKEF